MFAMSPEVLLDPNTSWKAKAVAWLASQGVSTVLLFAILVGVHQSWPGVMDQWRAGYDQNAKQLESAAEKYAKTVDVVMSQWREDRSLILEMIRSNTAAIRMLQAEMRAIPPQAVRVPPEPPTGESP